MKKTTLKKIIAGAICVAVLSPIVRDIEAKASTMNQIDSTYKAAYEATIKAREVGTQSEINIARIKLGNFHITIADPSNTLASTLSAILDKIQHPFLVDIVSSIEEMNSRDGKVSQSEINRIRVLMEGDEYNSEDNLPFNFSTYEETWNAELDVFQQKILNVAFSSVETAEKEMTEESKNNAYTIISEDLALSSRDSMRQIANILQNRLSKIEKKDGKIKAGMYKVGTDIPAGEYIIFAKSNGYVEISKDSSGTFESIIGNEIIDGNFIVTVNDGEYLKVQSGDIYPFDKAPKVEAKDGVYSAGMYKVGVHIPAGEYKVMPKGGVGYIEVRRSSSLGLERIISNNILSEESYITIKDGQYIKIQRAELKK